MSYYTIIGDIINSKKILDRNVVQRKLDNTLQSINKSYVNDIASRFAITLGDEFQAILYDSTKIFEIITRIDLEMIPTKIRYAVGYGEITTDFKDNSLGMDGSSWWNARNTIDEIKQKHERGLKEIASIRVNGFDNKPIIDLINTSISLATHIRNKWKDEHINIIKFIINKYGLTSNIVQSKIADQLNITPSDLNKKLKTSRYFDYAILFEKVIKVLEEERGE